MKLPMKSVITVRARCTAAIAGAIVLLPALINAQTKPLAAAPAAQEEVKLEKFVVTGSYIPTTGTAMDATVSPVVRIDRPRSKCRRIAEPFAKIGPRFSGLVSSIRDVSKDLC